MQNSGARARWMHENVWFLHVFGLIFDEYWSPPGVFTFQNVKGAELKEVSP
jgi:hypothetical protein